MNDFDAYRLYISIILYFDDKFDFIKYKSTLKHHEDSYEKKSEEYKSYYRKLLKEESIEDFAIAAALKNVTFIGNAMNDMNVHERKNQILKFRNKPEYFIKRDISYLSNYGSFKQCFLGNGDRLPLAFTMAMCNKITEETLACILNAFPPMIYKIDTKYKDHHLYYYIKKMITYSTLVKGYYNKKYLLSCVSNSFEHDK